MASFFWILQESIHSIPTGAQIVAGQNGSGGPAIGAGSVLDTGQASPVDAASAVSGLLPGLSYEIA
jgi:hypothetical protein